MFSSQLVSEIVQTLESGSRVLGLALNFHDLTGAIVLPEKWEIHHHPSCLEIKSKHQATCSSHCGGKVRKSLQEGEQVMVDSCPFGHGQIAVLIQHQGRPAGVLFAAPWWVGQEKGPTGAKSMPEHPKTDWVWDRRNVVTALALRLEKVLQSNTQDPQPSTLISRKAKLLLICEKNLGSSFKLEGLARRLNLSSSRCGHLIGELFQCTFPQLMNRLRMEEAIRRLKREDVVMGNLALDLGFSDQSHFNRVFKKHYGQTPRVWKKLNSVEV